MMDITVQRVDKWLWFTRLVKTRSQASKLISSGKVRINKVKVTKPAAGVKEGDVITAVIHQKIRIVKVLKPGHRRGSAPEAQELYESLEVFKDENGKNHSQVSNVKNNVDRPIAQSEAPKRDKGAGRPTKRDRRQMDAFHRR